MTKRRRGRPLGFKLSDSSKKAISDSKTGQRHSEATKEKISSTLIAYFKNKYPLSSELMDEYSDIINDSDEHRAWFDNIVEYLDDTEDVCTERSLNSKRFREISIEYNISMEENPYATRLLSSPEELCLLKEKCKGLGLNFKEVCHILGILV